MYEQSHRDYLRSGYPAASSACHGLLIITVITPLPTKPGDKAETGRRTAITDMQMRQRDICCARSEIHEELADAKAENDALRDDVAAGRRQFAHQSSLSVSAWEIPPPAWIMQPPPD